MMAGSKAGTKPHSSRNPARPCAAESLEIIAQHGPGEETGHLIAALCVMGDPPLAVVAARMLVEFAVDRPDEVLAIVEQVIERRDTVLSRVLAEIVVCLMRIHRVRPAHSRTLLSRLVDHPDPDVSRSARLALLQNEETPQGEPTT